MLEIGCNGCHRRHLRSSPNQATRRLNSKMIVQPADSGSTTSVVLFFSCWCFFIFLLFRVSLKCKWGLQRVEYGCGLFINKNVFVFWGILVLFGECWSSFGSSGSYGYHALHILEAPVILIYQIFNFKKHWELSGNGNHRFLRGSLRQILALIVQALDRGPGPD